MKPWTLLILILLAFAIALPARAQDCPVENTQALSFVYEVWLARPTADGDVLELRGLATLIDRRGVLLTAAHVVETELTPFGPVRHFLKLPEVNEQISFEVAYSPPRIGARRNADWALLISDEIAQAEQDRLPPRTYFSYSANGLTESYVAAPPGLSAVQSTSNALLLGVEATETLQCARPTGYMLRATPYERGDSGAAVVHCGDLAAVTSRFIVTFNDQTVMSELKKELDVVAGWLKHELPPADGDDLTKRYQQQQGALTQQSEATSAISSIEQLFDDADAVVVTPMLCVAGSVAQLYLEHDGAALAGIEPSKLTTDINAARSSEPLRQRLLQRMAGMELTWLELIELHRSYVELRHGSPSDERLAFAIGNLLDVIATQSDLVKLSLRIGRYLGETGTYVPPPSEGLVDSLIHTLATAQSLHDVRKALLNQDLALPELIAQSSAPIDVARRILLRRNFIPVDEMARSSFLSELENSIALLLVGLRDGFNKGASLDSALYNNALIDLAQMIQLRRRLIVREQGTYDHRLAELRITQYLLSRDASATVGWGTAFVTSEDMDNEVLTWLLRSTEKVSACPDETCGVKARTAIESNRPIYVELPNEVRAVCRNRLELALPQPWEALSASLKVPDLKRYYLRLRDAERNGTLQFEMNNVLSKMGSAGAILVPYPCAPIAILLGPGSPELPSGPTQIADWMAIAGLATPTGIPFPLPPLTRTGEPRVRVLSLTGASIPNG